MICFHEIFSPSLFLPRVFSVNEATQSYLTLVLFPLKIRRNQNSSSQEPKELSNETSERPFTVPLPADRSGRVGCLLRGSGWSDVFFFPGGWLMNREVSNKWYAKPTPLIGSNSKVVLFIIFTRGKITLFLVRRGDYTTWFLGIAITMN